MHGGELVAGQRPGRGGPDQQRRFAGQLLLVVDQRKPHVDARIGHFAIALADFAGAEGRAALGPPPDDLVPLVEQPAIEQIFQRPPDAFDVALVDT